MVEAPLPVPSTPKPARHPVAATILGLAMVGALGALDRAVGAGLTFTALLIVPVALSAWFAGRPVAILVATTGAAIVYTTDVLSSVDAPPLLVSAWNAGMTLGVLLFAGIVTSALRNAHDVQRKLARTDALTGAVNRGAFLDLLGREVRRSSRYRRPLTLAYFDIDNFKTVNDLYGHAEGDRLLGAIVSSLREAIRESDQVGRMGGDEFALLLPETGSDAVQPALDKCRRVMTEAVARGGWPVTFSFGAVTCTVPLESPETLLRKADALLQEAKRTGKNRMCHETLDVRPAPDPS